ncbi:2,3-diphosphoglycerate-dependent phosphoglycerate mutase [uncultured Pseudokineococcus sp.]|uniref:2,3-diphosphoglycerate-dependent phosphoglycerate mutase n=1 Tax=uncultured Pseudokineococcus sp. TaxID=1642928 RepID=UPI002616AAD3|nr:2,3-diphosphoglycerate-dependent phosphoglycerate mutase [uncultured Pseudokineococcus sp.]
MGDRTTGALVLLRHGQSAYNAERRFTGLLDPDLTERGVAEARRSAAELDAAALVPDVVLASPLRRARRTADLVVEELRGRGREVPDPEHAWALAERHYGAWTGRLKEPLRAEVGADAFHVERRCYDGAPPPTAPDHERLADLGPALAHLPAAAARGTEALADVVERVGPWWREVAWPLLREGRTVLVVAHGNSLRALCAVLDDLAPEEVEALNLPTGQPLVYRRGDDGALHPRGGTYLDGEGARAAAAAVAAEGGT